jgi:hypothetical protein
MTAIATTTTAVPAWIAPGAPVAILVGLQGFDLPMSINEGVIAATTPWVITLTDGTKFDMDTKADLAAEEPFLITLADPAAEETIALADRVLKAQAREYFKLQAAAPQQAQE